MNVCSRKKRLTSILQSPDVERKLNRELQMTASTSSGDFFHIFVSLQFGLATFFIGSFVWKFRLSVWSFTLICQALNLLGTPADYYIITTRCFQHLMWCFALCIILSVYLSIYLSVCHLSIIIYLSSLYYLSIIYLFIYLLSVYLCIYHLSIIQGLFFGLLHI